MDTVVVGGGGFLGSRIVQMLIERGDRVRVIGRNSYPKLTEIGAQCIQADICDQELLTRSMGNAELVFLTAAHAGYWGKIGTYQRVNVDGTRAVLEAARSCGVSRFVFTSTPSVIGYETNVSNAPNTLPYAQCHESPYPETKAQAEKMVLRANTKSMATVALRPHIIFGPGDRHVLPRMIAKAAGGSLRQIGNGLNMVDMTYLDNAAGAHLDAALALRSFVSPCAGNAYFISNNEPVPLWGYLNGVLKEIGLPLIHRQIPLPIGRLIGAALEFAYDHFKIAGEPAITRYLASMLARDHWYDMKPAMDDFGYHVRVSMQEGTERTIAWLKSARPWENIPFGGNK